MQLRSPAFDADQQLPLKYTKDGENVAPPIEWSELPDGTEELALLFEDVTGGGEPFAQWIVYRISPELDGLPEGIKHKTEPAEAPVRQGANSLENVGYDGPLGTEGRTFRLVFRLFALDRAPDLPDPPDRETLLRTMERHVLDEAELPVVFVRPRG